MTRLRIADLTGQAVPGIPEGAVEGVSMVVEPGDIAAVFGAAGSGTHTLIRLLAALDRPTSGKIIQDEGDITHDDPHERRFGVVLRDALMFPGTVAENVGFGLRYSTRDGGRKWRAETRTSRIREVLRCVGLQDAQDEDAQSLPHEDRARVALARALAPSPTVLLLEAPTHAVGEVLKPDYRASLRQILRSISMTTIIFTDDLRDAVGIADDLHVMVDGRFAQSGTLSRVLAGPNSIPVAHLLGYVTLIRGEVSGNWILEETVGAVQFPKGFPLRSPATALAHPAAMLAVPEDSGLGCGVAGTVERIRATGPTYLLDVRIGERMVEARWEWDIAPPSLRSAVALAVNAGTLRFFNDPNGAARSAPDRPPASEGDETRDQLPPTAELEPDAPDVEAPSTGDALERGESIDPSDEPPDDAADSTEDQTEDRAPTTANETAEVAGSLWARPGQGPAPAAAPPRSTTPSEPPAREPADPNAPWTSASTPAVPSNPSDRHRGMPLD